MTIILIIILVSLLLTFFFRLKARRICSNDFKKLSIFIILVSAIYFFLLFAAAHIGGESTPVWITVTNKLDKKINVYNITVYDHPNDDLGKFVYKSPTLNAGDSSTTIIEYDGATEFWTIGVDDQDKIVFFSVTNSHSIEAYDFVFDKNFVADASKAAIAINEINIYEKDKLTKNILIAINIIMTLMLLFEILTSKSNTNSNLAYDN